MCPSAKGPNADRTGVVFTVIIEGLGAHLSSGCLNGDADLASLCSGLKRHAEC